MQFPIRVLLALFVLGAFGGIAVWGIVAVLPAKSMTQSQRMMAIGGTVVLMAALAAWMILLWPTYWDWVALTFPSASTSPKGPAILSE